LEITSKLIFQLLHRLFACVGRDEKVCQIQRCTDCSDPHPHVVWRLVTTQIADAASSFVGKIASAPVDTQKWGVLHSLLIIIVLASCLRPNWLRLL
jgi:hypothetical protein